MWNAEIHAFQLGIFNLVTTVLYLYGFPKRRKHSGNTTANLRITCLRVTAQGISTK